MKKIKIFMGIILLTAIISFIVYSVTLREPENISASTAESASPDAVQASDALDEDAPLEVIFSHESGFYDEPIQLTLSTVPGARIFYTMDGSYPTTASIRYTRPITIDAPAFNHDWFISNVTVFSIRAIAVSGSNVSEIETRNFVMGDDVFARFCDYTLVFVLNSDPHGLYDHHDGILVEGIDREIFRQEFFDEHGVWPEPTYNYGEGETPASPANFNRRGREAERPVHVEVFSPFGEILISQQAGMRVMGGFSRAQAQKTLELFARAEYGDRNTFRFAFFDNEFTHDGQLIDRYRRVRLRNGGSDRDAGFIRDELSQTLFRQAGHSLTQTHRPAAVFLNGEYYGVVWLKSPRTGNHLERIFGGSAGNFASVEGGDRRFDDSWWYGDDEHAVADMREVSSLAAAGFTGSAGQARFEEFCRRVCLDDIIRYYAMQIYINNLDWPNHNMELWRYYPSDEDLANPDLHPYLRDGRWRVFSHDLEAAWSIWDDDNDMARADTLYDILTGESPGRWNSWSSSAILYALVERPDTRARLANTFVDLIEGAFSPDNVISVLDELEIQIQHELQHALRMNIFHPENQWWPSIDSVYSSRDAIRRFARLRPQVIYNSVSRNLGFRQDERFTVNLSVAQGGTAVMNSRPVSSDATGNYYAGTSIVITAMPNIGYTVDYWTVNGVRESGSTVTIDGDADVELFFIDIQTDIP